MRGSGCPLRAAQYALLRTSQTADNELRGGPFHFGNGQAKYTYWCTTRVVLAGEHSYRGHAVE